MLKIVYYFFSYGHMKSNTFQTLKCYIFINFMNSKTLNGSNFLIYLKFIYCPIIIFKISWWLPMKAFIILTFFTVLLFYHFFVCCNFSNFFFCTLHIRMDFFVCCRLIIEWKVLKIWSFLVNLIWRYDKKITEKSDVHNSAKKGLIFLNVSFHSHQYHY